MIEPSELSPASRRRLRRLRFRALLTLLAERLTLHFWRLAYWVMLFAGLWLLQVVPAVPAFFVFIGGVLYLLHNDSNKFRWPSPGDIDRRLEQDGHIAHRPLTRLEDRLANPRTEPTRQLWKNSLDSAVAAIAALRAPRTKPLLARRDPVALRVLVLLVLAAGICVAGPQGRGRLAAGLFPFSFGQAQANNSAITMWITPPDYTGLPRITLQGTGRSSKTIDLPEGSTIKVVVQDGVGRPELVMGKTRLRLAPLDAGQGRGWGAAVTAEPADRLEISQFFFTRFSISVHYIPDTPPRIALKGEPQALPKGPLQFDAAVQDDYGVTGLSLHMELDPVAGQPPQAGAPVDESRAAASPPGQEIEVRPVYDLTGHPWAGLPALVTLSVKDHKGQTARAQTIHVVLPERPFYNPAAKKLIALRKELIWTPEASIPGVIGALYELLDDPAGLGNDPVVYLSVRSAASRLALDQTVDTAHAVIGQLWDTALRLEDGNLSLAARDLRAAQDDLAKLLDDPKTTQEQIATAMEKMKQAMAAYMMELYKEAQKDMAQNGRQAPPQDSAGKSLDLQDLSDFLDQMQSQALSGDRDAAQKMLSQLRQMTDRLDPSMSMQVPPEMKALMDNLKGLEKLTKEQQELLDRTKDGAQALLQSWPPGQAEAPGMPPAPQARMNGAKLPPADTQAAKDRQEALRHELGQLMPGADQGNGIPENMQKAEQEMRGSSSALGRNDPEASIPHQEQVLENLGQAQDDMKKKLSEMMKQMTMLSLGMGRTDPLGHPLREGNGTGMGSNVKIPDQAERKRVQEILKTLRDRSGDYSRPDYELDYYKRLMKQF